MRRRELLGACSAVLAGAAGCLSGRSGGTTGDDGPQSAGSTRTGTGTPSSMPTETPTSTPSGLAMSVTVESLQPAIRYLFTDAIGVTGSGQYLFLRLSASSGTPPERSDLAFRFDGREFPPSDAQRAGELYRLYDDGDSRYDADRGEGWILFELPETGDASDAALVWDGGEWLPDELLRERLAAPSPSLSLEWSVPDPVEIGSNPEIELSVTNEGDLPGYFVGAINRKDWQYAYYPLTTVDRTIPAGETVTWTVTDDLGIDRDGNGTPGDGQPDVTYDLRWQGGRRRREVGVVGR